MDIEIKAFYDALARVLEQKENVIINVRIERIGENVENSTKRICGD